MKAILELSLMGIEQIHLLDTIYRSVKSPKEIVLRAKPVSWPSDNVRYYFAKIPFLLEYDLNLLNHQSFITIKYEDMKRRYSSDMLGTFIMKDDERFAKAVVKLIKVVMSGANARNELMIIINAEYTSTTMPLVIYAALKKHFIIIDNSLMINHSITIKEKPKAVNKEEEDNDDAD